MCQGCANAIQALETLLKIIQDGDDDTPGNKMRYVTTFLTLAADRLEIDLTPNAKRQLGEQSRSHGIAVWTICNSRSSCG
jgi:hypothetical protein